MSRYNSQAFTPEEVKQGLHLDLINYLLSYNAKSKSYFNDLHITSEGYWLIIDWVTEDYDNKLAGFEFVGEDQLVVQIVNFPDGTYAYATDDTEALEFLNDWLQRHPEWEKDERGRWYNKNETLTKEILN